MAQPPHAINVRFTLKSGHWLPRPARPLCAKSGHNPHIVAIAFIAFALVMAGVAMEAAKDNQNAEATEVLQRR